MATEVVKLVTGVGEPLLGRVLVIDALRARWSEVPLAGSQDRSWSGRSSSPDAVTDAVPDVVPNDVPDDRVPSITVDELAVRLGEVVLIDVREPAEAAMSAIPGAQLIPLGGLLDGTRVHEVPRGREVVVHCAVGGRSAIATQVLRAEGIDAVNLEGGIHAWLARG
jgi:sulfur-carrier protein adenylyltransferase/sulfurtransferase